jgi:citronellol/citronellal dehydrogenase
MGDPHGPAGPGADAVSHERLAAPSGGFITGTVLTVDGGGKMWGEFWPLGRPDYFRVED